MNEFPSLGTMERRKVRRFNLNLETNINANNSEMSDCCRSLLSSNVSSRGVFLLTGEPLPLNTRVNLGFVLQQDLANRHEVCNFFIDTSGRVVRITEAGMAISFDKKCKIRTSEVTS